MRAIWNIIVFVIDCIRSVSLGHTKKAGQKQHHKCCPAKSCCTLNHTGDQGRNGYYKIGKHSFSSIIIPLTTEKRNLRSHPAVAFPRIVLMKLPFIWKETLN